MKTDKKIKILSFAMALSIVLVQIFALSPLAANGVPTKWVFSEDQQYLTNETSKETYHAFFNGVSLRPDSNYVYVYEQSIEYAGLSYLSVSASPNYEDAVWIDYYEGFEIFVTDKGEAELLAFTEGQIGRFFMENSMGERSEFDRSLLDRLDSESKDGGITKTFDVRDLKPQGNTCKVYDIIAQDESKTFAYTYGAIYSFADGQKWYVNYTELDNSYFDAQGNFSYRSGSVKMTRIIDQSEINKAINRMSPYEVIYDYEWTVYDDDNLNDAEQSFFMIIFWIMYVIAIVLPAVILLVLGFVLPRFKKLGKPKYWYFLMLFAALWLILAIVLGGYLIFIAFL